MTRAIIAIVLILAGIGLAQPVDEHTLAYWKLNEGSGTLAEDSSSYGNHGTIVNAVWTTDAKTGGAALEFNGQDSQVSVADSATLHPQTGDITMGAWIKVFSNPKGWSNGGAIVYKGGAYQWAVNTNGALWLGIWGARFESIGTYDFEQHLDEWHHVVTTFDSVAQKAQIYVDGELNIEGTAAAAIDQTANELYIGYKADGGGRFHGIIDDVRISDIVRTQDEVKASMLGTAGYPFAGSPNPQDGIVHENTWANFFWKPGDFAVSHDVYLGESFDDVNNGTGDTFRGNQTAPPFLAGFPGYAYPNGLVPGTTYYWRIDEVNDANAASPWKGEVWNFIVPPREAYQPTPAAGDRYVDANVTLSWMPGYAAKLHYLYFGDNFDDVNGATGAPALTTTTYVPGALELEKSYYWRVDEFDGAVTHKGHVWTFTTMPAIAPAEDPNLIAWWTFDEGMGQTALDWSGHGNHGVLFGAGWTRPGLLGDAALNFTGTVYVAIQNLIYAGTDYREVTVCTWLRTSVWNDQYIASFDRDQYWRLSVGTSNTGPGHVGWHVLTSSGQVDLGSVTRVDDGVWHHACCVFDNGRMTIYVDGRPDASVVSGMTFGTGNTRYGLLGAHNNAATFNGSRGTGSPIAGDIDDLRIYDRALTQDEITLVMRGEPLLAWNPNPADGSNPDVDKATPLTWSSGDRASQHDVYFGMDREAVKDADASDTTGIYRGRQSATSYTPAEGVEWGGGPYFWRIDENNNDGTVTKGRIWSFAVGDFLVVDDIESYNDINEGEPGSNRIYLSWMDGFGTTTNGAFVGNLDVPLTERGNVHSGGQAMPLAYDNNFKFSEATLTLTGAARDWTREGVANLSLWFRGDAANAAERMYVALNGTAAVYHNDPNAARTTAWTEWVIPLQTFAGLGVNLTNVTSITIGFGTRGNTTLPGGTGQMYIDDIRLYRSRIVP